MKYELVLDLKDYNHPERRFITILPESLEEIDSFTISFDNELDLKYYLLKKDLIHESNIDGKIRIRKSKENKVLPGKVIYKNNAYLFRLHNLINFYIINSSNEELMKDLYYSFKSSVGNYGVLYSLLLPIRDFVKHKEDYDNYQEVSISDAIEEFIKVVSSHGYKNIHKLVVLASKYQSDNLVLDTTTYIDNQTRLDFIREQLNNPDLLPEEIEVLEHEEYKIIREMERNNESSSRH